MKYKKKPKQKKIKQKDDDEDFVLSFGEPQRVLESNKYNFHKQINNNLNYKGFYTPPYDKESLAKTVSANAHHASCLEFRKNMLSKFFVASSSLAQEDFENALSDYLIFGECFFLKYYNAFDNVARLEHLNSNFIRRMKDERGKEVYCSLETNGYNILNIYEPDEILRVFKYTPNNCFYGTPDWIGALQSILLNEDATLFRRKYYINGAHAGYILCGHGLSKKTEQQIEANIRETKGNGNFRTMFINSKKESNNAISIVPIGDIAQKDEFEKIKNISAEDVIVVHRIRPELTSVVIRGTAHSVLDVEKVSRMYVENEVRPLSLKFSAKNALFRNIDPFNFKLPSLKENDESQM